MSGAGTCKIAVSKYKQAENARLAHIDARAKEAFFAKFNCESARNLLDLIIAVFPRIDFYAAFRAAERHIDDRALVGHKRRERFHLVCKRAI